MAVHVCRDIQGYDVLQTGIGRYKNFNEARTEARQWPELEGIQYELMMRIVVTGGRDFRSAIAVVSARRGALAC